ncbi:MAG TPA: S8 family serine peptidase [Candidatus Coprenecus pullistercoris]|nr:S8 family serine peptidase [Candidatus Coprenecus pullistercoris]
MFKHGAVILTAALMTAAFSSCSMDEDRIRRADTIVVDGREVPSSAYEQGMVRLLLTEEMAEKLNLQTDADGQLVTTGVKSVDDAFATVGVRKIERTFPYAGKFEKRTREAGLHLWYDVYFDENTGLTRAGEQFGAIDGVDYVEYRPQIVPIGGPIRPYTSAEPAPANALTELYNDPQLSGQWHYYNDGTKPTAVAGCDINVLPVWQRGIVGSRYTMDGREVIVSIVDGGIDYSHEDLAANLWNNPVTSDPNELHGKSFVNGYATVVADDHGTHVAGTVAAVNNNGKGVAGVAGGDAAKGIEGVRLMSCQIFADEASGNSAGAIKWGADHGAVISQNSWGYKKGTATTITQSERDAIDYFIANAGYDENGNQVGPMAGGVVIFAAGNDAVATCYPGQYEPCIAVAALGPDFKHAWYTNYGSWIDVCAPGGDTDKALEVLSTAPGNSYALMEGTSMACPHVSGLAALLVSYFGGEGFTNEALRDMIENSARDISQYEGSQYTGHGLIDAERALAAASTIAPDPIDDLQLSVRANFIDYSFTVPADEDDTKPSYAYIYYSKEPINIEDSMAVEALPKDTVNLSAYKVGDRVSGAVSGLEFETKYYVSASVSDFARNRSELCPVEEVTTGANSLPVFKPSDELDTLVKIPNNLELDLTVVDADGHTLTPVLPSDAPATVRMLNDSTVRVTVSSLDAGIGSHTVELTVNDGFGGEAVKVINVEVIDNIAPTVTAEPEPVVMSMDGTVELNLADYFYDGDGDMLIYRIKYSVNGVVNGTTSGDKLTLTPLSEGSTVMTITAYDAMDATASIDLSVTVGNGSSGAVETQVQCYPNPVVDMLNVRTQEEVTGATVEILSLSGAVKRSEKDVTISMDKPFSIDLSGLPGGVYTVVIRTGSNVLTSEIAKL